jgi:hypothetical protein
LQRTRLPEQHLYISNISNPIAAATCTAASQLNTPAIRRERQRSAEPHFFRRVRLQRAAYPQTPDAAHRLYRYRRQHTAHLHRRRPEVSKWLWLAGVCWYVPRTLLTLNVNQDSVLDARGGATSPTFQDLAHWVEFTVPCLRLAFYSAGAYCCSLWLNRTRGVRGLPVGRGGNERKPGRKLRVRQADKEIALGGGRAADEHAGESRDEPADERRGL